MTGPAEARDARRELSAEVDRAGWAREQLMVLGAEFKRLLFGRTHITTSHCSTLEGNAAVGGGAVFTAANGDQVFAAYTATTVPFPPNLPLIVQQSEFVITGGTGRFEGASGTLIGMVCVTFEGLDDPAWPLEFAFVGTITY
jgi:hypothetical protein